MHLTPATPLSELFAEIVRPQMDAVASHTLFRRLEDASVTLAQCRKGLLGFYPLVEAFPRYMSLTLAKVGSHDLPRAAEARAWLMNNIRTEAMHAKWWVDWGRPVGLEPADFAAAQPSAAMDAQNHFLFRVATTGTIAEAAAAVNYAVEGATGIWTKTVAPAIPRIGEKHGFELDRRAMRWLEAHADYDDAHPREALEVV